MVDPRADYSRMYILQYSTHARNKNDPYHSMLMNLRLTNLDGFSYYRKIKFNVFIFRIILKKK